MQKLFIILLFFTTLFGIDFTFTKAYQNFNKGIKLIKQDPQQAQEYFQKAYILIQQIKNHPSSQVYYMLGRMYCNGWGIKQNLKKAEKYFKKALALGNQRVNCCIARLYIKMHKNRLARKYLNIAISHKNLYIYCKDIDIKNLKIKKDKQ